jgi:hypothetical protein
MSFSFGSSEQDDSNKLSKKRRIGEDNSFSSSSVKTEAKETESIEAKSEAESIEAKSEAEAREAKEEAEAIEAVASVIASDVGVKRLKSIMIKKKTPVVKTYIKVPLCIEGCVRSIGNIPYCEFISKFQGQYSPPSLSCLLFNKHTKYCAVKKKYAAIALLWLNYLKGDEVYIPIELVELMINFASNGGFPEIENHLNAQLLAHSVCRSTPFLQYGV